MSDERKNLLVTVENAIEAELCVIPPAQDGTKRPMPGNSYDWKHYQTKSPSAQEILGWYKETTRTGIGIVCGRVSGNETIGLEAFDADDREAWEQLKERAKEWGLNALLDKLLDGYSERTPSGAVHLLYFCENIGGNLKLATRPKRPEEKKHANDLIKTLFETRGEGGYIIIAPTYGSVHETGRPYELDSGNFFTMPTITPEEREALHNLARSFHAPDERKVAEDNQRNAKETKGAGRPGDDFNEKVTWGEVLEPHGWRLVFERNGTGYWQKPGGRENETHASTNHAGSDLLYVFSTATTFTPEQGYSKFSAYTHLNHNNDFRAAARTLATQGYGELSPLIERAENATTIGIENSQEISMGVVSKLRRGKDIKALDIKIEWHVDQLIPKGAVILFFGRGGLGKSTLFTMIGGAITTGVNIFGMQVFAAQVVYVDFENSLAILSKRLKDITADNVLFLDSTCNPPRLDRLERNLYLDILAAHPGAVFIFDTLRSAQSGDENDSKAMSEVLGFLRLLRDRGATVIVLHHTPKSSDRKYKGSSAIFDMADHVLGLYPVKQAGDDTEADEDEDEAKVFRFGTAMKTRYEPFRMFLTFDAKTRCFELAPDPLEKELVDIAKIIHGIGSDAKQGDIITAVNGEGISQKKAYSLLTKGEGRFWTSRRGVHNSKLYSLTENGLAVLQPYIGGKNCQTESSSAEHHEKQHPDIAQQPTMDTEFAGFSWGVCQTRKTTEMVMGDDLSIPF